MESVARNLNNCDTNPLKNRIQHPQLIDSGYHEWLSSQQDGKYTHRMYIPTSSDPCNGLAFHWKFDNDSSKIHIAVAVKATGWSAFGFSEAGGMKGADIVYYEADKNELVDSHVSDGYMRPTSLLVGMSFKIGNSTWRGI